MKLSTLLLTAVLLVVALSLWQMLSQPGVGDLAGDYKEVAMYRNENNTGPIVRIYAVTTPDTLWQEMKAYGELMPHTKYGTTTVYFFSAIGEAPKQLSPGDENFESRYKAYCLARYEKNNMGQVAFIRFPFPAQ